MKRLATVAAIAALATISVIGVTTAQGEPPEHTPGVSFPGIGSTSAPSGKGGFRFGVSSSATQIEDKNPTTDWYQWTAPKPEGQARSPFVGEGVAGYTKAGEDIELVKKLGVDSYRFGIEWARIEPRRDVIDEAALAHYSRFIDQLRANGIRPMVTIHHFAMPAWVDNPADPGCAAGPGDTNLCGLDNPEGAPLVIAEMAEHAALLADRFGDRVDEWVTVNEPMVYLMFSQWFGVGPPGKANLAPGSEEALARGIRNYVTAHVAMYDAVKAHDGVDATGGGVPASVGLTNSVHEFVPVRGGKVSSDPADLAAVERYRWLFDDIYLESIWQGGFDADLDGAVDEAHPDWRGKIDWLGAQFYSRVGVSAPGAAGEGGQTIPVVDVDFCLTAPCLPQVDPTHFVPMMGYEASPQGLHAVLKDLSHRFGGLPLVVTESGLATSVGTRRAEYLVRALEAIDRARAEGVDVRGYYHWSLTDNFEWLSGYAPTFGLYAVDRTTMARTPTEAATVYGQVTAVRGLSDKMRQRYGGFGPMTAEPAS